MNRLLSDVMYFSCPFYFIIIGFFFFGLAWLGLACIKLSFLLPFGGFDRKIGHIWISSAKFK